jgi:hypothetical protein
LEEVIKREDNSIEDCCDSEEARKQATRGRTSVLILDTKYLRLKMQQESKSILYEQKAYK